MGLIREVASGVVVISAAAFAKLLADEAKAWLPALTERIVRRAICKLPIDKQERFAEEWRADLGQVPGDMSRLLVALGFLIGATRISARSGRRRSMRWSPRIARAISLVVTSTFMVALVFNSPERDDAFHVEILSTPGFGNSLAVAGVAQAKRHRDNPASNPLGPAVGKLGADAAFFEQFFVAITQRSDEVHSTVLVR